MSCFQTSPLAHCRAAAPRLVIGVAVLLAACAERAPLIQPDDLARLRAAVAAQSAAAPSTVLTLNSPWRCLNPRPVPRAQAPGGVPSAAFSAAALRDAFRAGVPRMYSTRPSGNTP